MELRRARGKRRRRAIPHDRAGPPRL